MMFYGSHKTEYLRDLYVIKPLNRKKQKKNNLTLNMKRKKKQSIFLRNSLIIVNCDCSLLLTKK